MNLESTSIADINSSVLSFSAEDSISDLEPTNNIHETQLTDSQWDDSAIHIEAEELNLDNYAIETISNPQISGDAPISLKNTDGETGTTDGVFDDLSGAERVVAGYDDTLLTNEEAEQAGEVASLSYQVAAGNEEQREQLIVALTGKEADNLTNVEKQNLDLLFDNLVQGQGPAVDFSVASQAPLQDILAENPQLDDNTLSLGTNGAFVKNDSSSGGTALLSVDLEGQDLLDVAKEEYGEAIAAEAAAMGIDLAPGDVGARLLAVSDGTSLDPATNPDAFINAPEDTAVVMVDGDIVEAEANRVRNVITFSNSVQEDGRNASGNTQSNNYRSVIDAIRQAATARVLLEGGRADRVGITPNFNGEFNPIRVDMFLGGRELAPSIQLWIEPTSMYIVGIGYGGERELNGVVNEEYQYRPIGQTEGQTFIPTLVEAGYADGGRTTINVLPGIPESYTQIENAAVQRANLNIDTMTFNGNAQNYINIVDNGINGNAERRSLLNLATAFAEGARFNGIAERIEANLRNDGGTAFDERLLRATTDWGQIGQYVQDVQRNPNIRPVDLGNNFRIDNLRDARNLISLVPGSTTDTFPGGPSS
ncbi:hypothetical protein H1P_1070020 [Hyella patelloides LEGE 07179]|uniref:Uncharacterized protein n=1 Tax=Hyella patelloides LEGE 07179 TaxID=945734 RepID=A0A563VJ89_9CYAN|nr:ribosome-inactivating family protein [Hyella patelloides]VEP11508.1 hypothetical protein H1P_1070020 [Hyella patelloides LEGE 07179]